jgi:hypothetical protein
MKKKVKHEKNVAPIAQIAKLFGDAATDQDVFSHLCDDVKLMVSELKVAKDVEARKQLVESWSVAEEPLED